jgi:hypothetical protein
MASTESPRHVDDATLVGLDLPAKDSPRGVQGANGGVFVSGHQARVANRIGGENRRQPLPECLLAQPSSSSRVVLRRMLLCPHPGDQLTTADS